MFFETLKLLEVPFPQVNFSADSFEDLGSDWILKDLGSSGGRGIKKNLEENPKVLSIFRNNCQERQ